MCRLDRKEALKRRVFDNLGINEKDLDYELKWFGSAPLCNATPCDAIVDGYIPILSDKYGDGGKCIKGEKYLGIKIKGKQYLGEETVERYKDMCMELKVDDEKTKNRIIESIFEM